MVVIVAALLAGWVLPSEPMAAAVLFLGPTIALGAVRAVTAADTPGVGSLLFAVLGGVIFAAIFSHLEADMALRRRPAD